MSVRTLTVALVAVLLSSSIAGLARADDDEVRGACSGGASEFRLRVRPDDGRLRVRFEIDGSASGDRWQLFLSNDGVRIVARTKVADEGGRVRVRRGTEDGAGRDRISAFGVNLDSGESCSASIAV